MVRVKGVNFPYALFHVSVHFSYLSYPLFLMNSSCFLYCPIFVTVLIPKCFQDFTGLVLTISASLYFLFIKKQIFLLHLALFASLEPASSTSLQPRQCLSLEYFSICHLGQVLQKVLDLQQLIYLAGFWLTL